MCSFAFEVQVGGGDEGVDAAALRRGVQRLAGPVDVVAAAAGQRGDDGRRSSRGDRPHGLGVGLGGDREARFDHVHAERVELPGELQLLGHAQREPGRLLAVAQRRVEDGDAVCHEASIDNCPNSPATYSQIYNSYA